MTDLRPLGDGLFATPQIQPRDVQALKAQGVGLIINNRPDGEDADQPADAEIAKACADAGIAYRALPVSGLPDSATANAQYEAVSARNGDVVMFCRSGMRSTAAWAMGAVAAGDVSADEARSRAAQAGYDISRLPL